MPSIYANTGGDKKTLFFTPPGVMHGVTAKPPDPRYCLRYVMSRWKSRALARTPSQYSFATFDRQLDPA